jgi:hypothetical protein
MIRGLSPAAARHELKDDGWIAGNVFLQKRNLRPDSEISGAPCLARLNNRNRLALVEGRLPENRGRQNHERAKK